MAGRMISGAAALAELVRAAGETETAGLHRTLPVVPELGSLLPGHGLRRGSTVAVTAGQSATAAGGTSLLLALLSEASRQGSWCAVVGVPSLGAIAAADSGIALDRLALVPDPGPEWPTVVAALIDGVDVIVLAVPGGVSASIATRLVARARQRGSVLVPYGDWSGADVTLRVVDAHWEGLDEGHGRLRRRRVRVLARGRGAAARPKEVTMWMPGVTIRPLTLPPAPGHTPSIVDHPTRPSLTPVPAATPQPPSSPAASDDRPARPAPVAARFAQPSSSPAANAERAAGSTSVAARFAQPSSSSVTRANRPAEPTPVAAGFPHPHPHPQPSVVSVDRAAGATPVAPQSAASVDRPVQLALVPRIEQGVAEKRAWEAGSDVDGEGEARRVRAFPTGVPATTATATASAVR